MFEFDIIICGGGHAGLEAAHVASKFGLIVGLFSLNHDTIGQMSCNPSIGGIAKGIVVRELDVFGGLMPQIADKSAIQYKKLNTKKGPAMQAIRQQTDKYIYSRNAQDYIGSKENILIIQDEIIDFKVISEEKFVIYTKRQMQYYSKALILTTGTFLNGQIYIGKYKTYGGRIGEFSSIDLSQSLLNKDIKMKRFKTGTPARVKKNSINYQKLIKQEGSNEPLFFSISSIKNNINILPILPCYIAHSNEKTKQIIIDHKDEIPLYSGLIKGIGPRYCPSFEDKVFKFQDKVSHQIFVEPEGVSSETVYLNGISTSLAEKYQEELLQTIEGFEDIKIVKPAYAVEYDIIDPTQLDHSLEYKKINNLFFAGQINGTSGYEEAAGQGFIAGINAALKILKKPKFILSRNESYIGVMIDDLVSKGVDEPYRLFTARAESRLEIRHDNAYERLFEYSKRFKLLDKEIEDIIEEELRRKKDLQKEIYYIKYELENDIENNKLKNDYEIDKTKNKITKKMSLDLVIKQGIIDFQQFYDKYCKEIKIKDIAESIYIDIKYEGYIEHERNLQNRVNNKKDIEIPEDFDYNKIGNLSFETKQRLNMYRPKRFKDLFSIPGLKPVDIITIDNELRKFKK